MRRWALQQEPFVDADLANALATQLRAAIKRRDRTGVQWVLSRAYSRRYKLGSEELVPLAHWPLNQRNGSTALHYAAEASARAICEDLVLFWGARLHAVNWEGKQPCHLNTPLTYAQILLSEY